MNYNNFLAITSKTKPLINEVDKQLFSYDVCSTGAKNFTFNTFKNMYNIILQSSNGYEDNTYAKLIKLFIDIDINMTFNNQLERNKYADFILKNILEDINDQLEKQLNIKNTKVIILISDTLLKLSLHIIYPEVVFSNMYEMKYFMSNISNIDQCVYRIGCFRMYKCAKLGKSNKLVWFKGINYIKPEDDYKIFTDCCICHVENIIPVHLEYANDSKQEKDIIKKIKNKTIKEINSVVNKDYKYKKINLDLVKSALNKLKDHSNEYYKWLIISCCLKDLYISADKKYQKDIYKIYEDFSKISPKYNKINNYNHFMKLEPKIDINYLFILSGDNYYFAPFYNYKDKIFNPKNHKNIIIKNETYIDVDIPKLLKFKNIFIKSATGTGKTTILKEIIKAINLKNILSITSRVNLASEHMKHINLQFYKDVKNYSECSDLVIQLESLIKCNYQLFEGGVIILDEVNSLFSHLRSPTLNKRRKEVYMYLVELIKNAKYVICLDADLSDWNIQFLNDIKNEPYIVYFNEVKNKSDNEVKFYKNPQIMIDKIALQIQNNIPCICSFDSLRIMNLIIIYLSKFGDKKDWLIYSSEINYDLIDTKKWINKFVFFTPTIIYGIDYNYKKVDVYSFVYKTHLNPLQVYQMISRARKQLSVNIYCKENLFRKKYDSVNDVIKETNMNEQNFGCLLPNYNNYIELYINDTAYRTMYNNYKYMDSILKTNIKEYLIDIMEDKGYTVKYDYKETDDKLDNRKLTKEEINIRIINLLNLDKNNLTEFEKELVTDDWKLEKHLNLRIYLRNDLDNKLIESIKENLLIETLTNKYTKIKMCKKLMEVLEINDFKDINKDLSKKFNEIITNKWLNDNIETIKKIFDIRAKKYDDFNYYSIYMLLMTIIKNLFDDKLLIKKICRLNIIKYNYYVIDNEILNDHNKIINKINLAVFLDD